VAQADPPLTSDGVPAQLVSACAEVTAARDADAVGGRRALYVAAPAATSEAAALLKAAAELGLTVVPRGTGSRLDWGAAPERCDLIVDTHRLNQVLEHAAGDLVCRVQAGVRLDDLASVLATAGQRLALDPPGSTGTIGGLISTGVAGPLRYRYGAPRDLLIGITVVRADGTIARSGGKVVKNVAGYDLGKLFASSYGTLGLITEAAFRLHPKPDAATWLTVDSPDPAAAQAAVRTMADSPLAPAAIELSWPSAAAPISVAVLLEGDDPSVTGRADRMVALLSGECGTADQRPDHTKRSDRRLSRTTQAAQDDSVIKVAFWSGQLAAVLDIVRTAAADQDLDPAVGGSAAAGVLHVSLPQEAQADAVVRFVAALRAGLTDLTGQVGGLPPTVASAVVLCAPPKVRDEVDMWGPVPSLALMRAVKDQFDPEHRMAPGRFAGGI